MNKDFLRLYDLITYNKVLLSFGRERNMTHRGDLNPMEIIMCSSKALYRYYFIQTPQQFSIPTLEMKKLRFREAKCISVQASLPLQPP